MGQGGAGGSWRHTEASHTLSSSSPVRSSSVYTGQLELGPNLLERQGLHYCSLWRAHVNLKPDRGTGGSPSMLLAVLCSVGLLIYTTFPLPLCVPVRTEGRLGSSSVSGPRPLCAEVLG